MKTRTLKKKRDITNMIDRLLSLDPYIAPFETIYKRARSLKTRDRNSLLSFVEKGLNRVDCRKYEPVRVGLVKVMVALVPESSRLIRCWLLKTTGRFVPEVHFSLFCFLHLIRELPSAQEFAKELPRLIEGYLTSVKHGTAKAPWMAGDLLGEHWSDRESLEILLPLANSAKFVAGREGALHGLAHLVSKGSSKFRDEIIGVIKQISEKDRSQKIQKYAQLILKGKSY
jgi:hypothetical protein